MSTSTLSKSQRKKLRRQMEERKKALMAKHGRAGSNGSAGRSGAGRPAGRPAFPKDPARAPYQPPKVVVAPAARPVVKPVEPVQPTQPARPTQTTRPVEPTQPRHAVAPAAPPAIRDLSAAGPGPLTRAAGFVEHMGRRAAAAYSERPWQERPLRRRAEAHRTLARLVPPLRIFGVAAVVGAVALAREVRGMGITDTGTLIVLGMGLGMAVMLLALAEISRALQVITRR